MVIARWPLPSSAPESWPCFEPRGVEARIGAQAIRRLEIHDQKRHRAVSPGLQDEAAIEFQRRAEQRRQHDRFAEQLADGGGIIVLGQDFVERGAEPGQPAAQIEGADLERQRRIVDRNGRRRADRGSADFRCREIARSWRLIWGRRG